ncbi:reverse transcriptase domain-containing protein [Tanacetum coccineum]
MSFTVLLFLLLLHMPKFASTFKSLLSNKEKLLELAKTPLNENCSAVLLKNLPKNLEDPGKFSKSRVIAQECARFSVSRSSGNPIFDPSSFFFPSFTPFEGGDFILEEIETFLHTPDELSNLDDDYYDAEGDILYLENLLNEDPSPTLPPMKNYDFKQVDVTLTKPLIEEPPELELKDLPSHLEYAILEGTDKLLVIISKELKEDEKAALLKVLKSHKWAIAWKFSDIKGIDTHKILMEDDFKPVVQHQRRVNSKIHEVIKKEVIKLLDAELIYPNSDSLWVSPIHYVPKKGGITIIENKENELIPTRLVTGWRVCIDYRKLNDATRKDHFSLPFMDQMLERLAGNEYYCFLDGFSGYFQIPIDPKDQEKTTFTCPYGTFEYWHMPFGLYNALGTFQRCMMAIFHDMIEETMEVFMDNFSVFGDSFSSRLSNLDKMLKRCEDTNLVLNWEKCHFMGKEGIVLGHKISKLDLRALPTNDARVVVKFLKSLLAKFGTPRAIISDRVEIPSGEIKVTDTAYTDKNKDKTGQNQARDRKERENSKRGAITIWIESILPKIEKTVNEQLEAEVLTRSSNESKTSHAVVANLSELELKKILIDKIESNKSIHRSDEEKNLYKALVDAYESDKLILDTYGDTVSFKRRRDDEDKDEEPSARSNRGSKRRRAGKEPESTSALKEKTSKITGKSTEGCKSHHKPTKLPSSDHDWNKTFPDAHGPVQPWLSSLAQKEDPRESFNELIDTPLDFSAFVMNGLKVDTLTPDLLVGLTFELMKGTCKSLVEIEYFFEEVYKVTTEKLDWNNPEGQQYPHDLRKPLPFIPNSRGRQVILFDHFINNDLAYLCGGVSSLTYPTISNISENFTRRFNAPKVVFYFVLLVTTG